MSASDYGEMQYPADAVSEEFFVCGFIMPLNEISIFLLGLMRPQTTDSLRSDVGDFLL